MANAQLFLTMAVIISLPTPSLEAMGDTWHFNNKALIELWNADCNEAPFVYYCSVSELSNYLDVGQTSVSLPPPPRCVFCGP